MDVPSFFVHVYQAGYPNVCRVFADAASSSLELNFRSWVLPWFHMVPTTLSGWWWLEHDWIMTFHNIFFDIPYIYIIYIYIYVLTSIWFNHLEKYIICWDVILPIDELHHFSRWLKSPTSHEWRGRKRQRPRPKDEKSLQQGTPNSHGSRDLGSRVGLS